MQVLFTILYILLFIVCLSTLIMVHEAGHLATAKIFKVYCFEYAIGFGPKLFSIKRKNQETAFSIRAIPFGGFVSMYGEEDALPEGVGPIDPSRSLNNIKKWKKCIILVSGVVMNFVLAMTIFFLYEIAFPAHIAHVAHINVKSNSIAYEAGLRNNDYVYTPMLEYGDYTFIFYDDNSVITYEDHNTKDVYFGYNFSSITLKNQSLYSYAIAFDKVNLGSITESYTPISYEDALNGDFSDEEVVNNYIDGFIRGMAKKVVDGSTHLRLAITENYLDDASKALVIDLFLDKDTTSTFYKYVPNGAFIRVVGDMVTTSSRNELHVLTTNFETSYPDVKEGNALTRKYNGSLASNIDVNFYRLSDDTPTRKGEQILLDDLALSDKGKLPSNIGVSMVLESYYQNYGTAVKRSFQDFGRGSTLIIRGLGQLFSKDGFKNVGGIIAIGVSSTQVLQENGFGMFLFYWALISVNLGIVNLLPFPGLDGWQLLVTIVEGTTRKEIPPKVKNIVSAIGIGLLFVLMILIIIKDLITVI